MAVAFLPVTSRQGVDWMVSAHRLPLYAKTLDFIDRDVNYQRLAAAITARRATDGERAMAVLEWTRANIRDQPAGFPVIDDHVWHIIIRGYGVDEQKADVFTVLTTYAGVPAYWFRLNRDDERLTLATARIDGRWRLFDVAAGIAFGDRGGRLATLDEIAANPSLVAAAAGSRAYRGYPYTEYFVDFRPPKPPDTLRAEKQMLLPRLGFELRRLVGLGGRDARLGGDSTPILTGR